MFFLPNYHWDNSSTKLHMPKILIFKYLIYILTERLYFYFGQTGKSPTPVDTDSKLYKIFSCSSTTQTLSGVQNVLLLIKIRWLVLHTLPACPCNFCTISLVWRFQMYTMWSSEPETIHWMEVRSLMLLQVEPTCVQKLQETKHKLHTFPPVTEKLAKTQYFSFLCPV